MAQRVENLCVSQGIPAHFELERCCEFVLEGNYTRVALQLPFELLKYAFALTHAIHAKTKSKVFILGDSPYHSCCVDEIQAEKLNCDCIIHFGSSCFSRQSTIPTLYVFNELEIEHHPFVTLVLDTFKNKDAPILIIYNTNCSRLACQIYSSLKTQYSSLVLSQLLSENTKEILTHVSEVCLGRRFTLKYGKDSYYVLYIGEEGRNSLNFRLAFHLNYFYVLSPGSQSIKEIGNENKLLKKRYYLMQKVENASIMSILIGNMWPHDYLSILSDIKSVLRKKGKEYYTISMGNIQPTKLANFLEIDLFVLLGCPENSILDSSEFYRPIITPYELYLSLSGSACSVLTENYRNDVSSLNNFPLLIIEDNEFVENESFASEHLFNSQTTQLEVKSDFAMQHKIQNDAALFLQGRAWQGLDSTNGAITPSQVETGKSGIPVKYTSEDLSQ